VNVGRVNLSTRWVVRVKEIDMDHRITIRVDTNDGDYVTETNKISGVALEKLRPAFKIMKEAPPLEYQEPASYGVDKGKLITKYVCNKWSCGDCESHQDKLKAYYLELGMTEEEYLEIEDLMPYPEYGFHTLESIKLSPWIVEEVLV
jgi:hypothetical protein